MAAIMGDCSCGCGECCGCDCEELAGEVLEDDLYLADGAGGLPGTYHEPYPDGLDGSTGTMAKYTFGGPCYWVDFTLVAVGLTALFCESGAWHELSGGTFSPLSTFNVVCDPFRVDVHLWYVVFDEWRHLKIRFTCSEKGITDSGGNALVDSSGNAIWYKE